MFLLQSHNVSFRCVRGRGLSPGHRTVDTKTKEAEHIPTVSVDCGFFGQLEDRAHDTLPALIVRDRKSKGIWSHPLPSKGVTHPYPARALMAHLDFTEYTKSSSSQIRSPALLPSVTLSRMVGTARLCLEHLPRARARATERSNVMFNLCTDLRELSKTSIEQQSGITLESRSPLLAWLVEHCSNLLLLFHEGEPHDGHTAYMRLWGKPWTIELPSFGECVDYRKRTRHKLESRWSRGVFVGVRMKTTERIVWDETGTCCSIRERVPEEQHTTQIAAECPWNALDQPRRCFDRILSHC